MNTDNINKALKSVKFPGFSRDIVSFGLVHDVAIDNGIALISIEITTGDTTIPEKIAADIKTAVGALDSIKDVKIKMTITAPKQQPSPSANGAGNRMASTAQTMQKVKYAIAVASGKGGVGKSTITVNLACALSSILSERDKPNAIGIMDCDIYGPSIPLMLGATSRPEINNDLIQPVENFGIRCMSMGLLIDDDSPVVWRGPMVMKTIQQFAQNVDWGELEILVVDLPPGTGDAQLSLVQTIPLEGAVIVTTPQPAAFNVARRGARMFEKVSVPLMGVIENMSYHELPDGTVQHIFGQGGGSHTASALKTELLGQIPLDPSIRLGSDNGIPIVISSPESVAAKEFFKIANSIIKTLANKSTTLA